MKDLFKKIAKNAALWFAAGALFAVGANFAAPLLGGGEIAGLAAAINPVWLGSMMAGATAIATAAEPLMDKIFGETPKNPPSSALADALQVKQPAMTLAQSLQQPQAQLVAASSYRKNIDAERMVALMSGEQSPKI